MLLASLDICANSIFIDICNKIVAHQVKFNLFLCLGYFFYLSNTLFTLNQIKKYNIFPIEP